MLSALLTNSPLNTSTGFALPGALDDPLAQQGQLARSPGSGYYLALAAYNARAGDSVGVLATAYLSRYLTRISGAADAIDISTVLAGSSAQNPAV